MSKSVALRVVSVLMALAAGLCLGRLADLRAEQPGGKYCKGFCIRWEPWEVTWECIDFQAPDCIHCSVVTCEAPE
ncbi:MAG: hypothetical protein QHJ34_14080 [bacterium]|nr:hypothetical protein [candidate division KSB1 bacterium]MDH7561338.1 hypothetical protein [bacterium]